MKPMSNNNGSAVYDVDALQRGLVSVQENIRAIQQGLDAERDKERDYLEQLARARTLLEMHGVDENGRPNRSDD